MKILVLNGGSSSLKSGLFEAPGPEQVTPDPLWKAQVDWSGPHQAEFTEQIRGQASKRQQRDYSFGDAIKELVQSLCQNKTLADLDELAVVGHRVVHGGTRYSVPTLVTDSVLSDLSALIELAPSHEPANIKGIQIARQLLPGIPQVAVFDTAFHASMPETSIVYPVPYDWYERLGIRRFGFHGINHQYCCTRAAQLLDKSLESLRIISCHLGSGASLCAVKNGKSQMNTMGYTPLAGLMMSKRCGSIDPGLILHLLHNKLFSVEELTDVLNKQSGLKGISGFTADMREIESESAAGNKRAKLAFDLYIERLVSEIASLLPVMGGVDVLIFTGGIGEHSQPVRLATCERLAFLGIGIDANKNSAADLSDADISAVEASVKTLVIEAREELAIAQACIQFGIN